MCGIVGYIGSRRATDLLLEGLRRLEYRGYDSAGTALIDSHGNWVRTRSVGRIDGLSSGQLAKWRARNVGFIFQFYNLLPVLSAERNVEVPLLLTKLSSKDRKRNVRAALERAGTPIGPLDTLIAAHAVAEDAVVVTTNEREFTRVAGLQVENWT